VSSSGFSVNASFGFGLSRHEKPIPKERKVSKKSSKDKMHSPDESKIALNCVRIAERSKEIKKISSSTIKLSENKSSNGSKHQKVSDERK
jgi:hypothetical protein